MFGHDDDSKLKSSQVEDLLNQLAQALGVELKERYRPEPKLEEPVPELEASEEPLDIEALELALGVADESPKGEEDEEDLKVG